MASEDSNTSSVYDELSSVYYEEPTPSDTSLSCEEVDESDPEITEGDNSESISEVIDSEGGENDIYTSSDAESIANVDSGGGSILTVESSVDSCESLADNDYLRGIYENTTYNVVFEFVLLLLLVITLFSRFLIKLIM